VFNHPTPFMQPIRKDTRAWTAQVWISFGVALTLCGSGLAWLPGAALDRAFMVMGYLFTLTSAFTLAKFVRDQEARRSDTPQWGGLVWGGFGAAMALTAWGLWRMEISPTYKAFLAVSWLFLVSAVFTLAKTLRDAHDARQAERQAERHAERQGAQRTTPPAAPEVEGGGGGGGAPAARRVASTTEVAR
jgi:hypothetical protein